MPQQPMNDVMLILERNGAVEGTGYADGLLNPSLREARRGEDVFDAVIWEGLEETGIIVDRKALRIVHARGRGSRSLGRTRPTWRRSTATRP
ncbi:hypothetical protein [Streptomyces sp. NPDC060027]|uniref:hypothetical protein n=1 Tax=Streptomyces sp. NPDC060027 TaxID=3347040 RepID=UPI0036C8681B